VDSPEIQAPEQALLDLRLQWMDEGTRRFDAVVRRLRDDELSGPSALPSWTRGHVVAHVARNADALDNLVTWARSGVETPMYATSEQRADDIEAGAHRSAEALRMDLEEAERRFSSAVASLPLDRWWTEVRTQTGRVISAAEIPWMRCREVWVHAVDLDAGATFADLPPALVETFLDEVTRTLGARDECDEIELGATDTERSWSIGRANEHRGTVRGPAHELLGWVLGRNRGAALTCSTGPVPTLPRWL
jgi:maleylpyruvate isomerase